MAIERIGIVGSGIMGRGIAEVCIMAGRDTVLTARTEASAEVARKDITGRLRKLVEKGKLAADVAEGAIAKLRVVVGFEALADRQLVVESIVEELEAKKALLRHLDEVLADPEAILATNTSTLPVTELAVVTRRPDKVIGVHFFNPAPLMKLVEVIPSLTTAASTVLEVQAFVTSLGKEAVEVKDQAGFIVNALLFRYLNHAVAMLSNQIATKEGIDTAMRLGCGHPMGPLALLDLIGLDTSVFIMDALFKEFAEPSYAPQPLLRRMVAAGKLGRKSGEGFYVYNRK